MRPWMRNRFVVLAAVLTVGIGLWNLYVAAHAHGLVSGQVVDRAGHPVAGAQVRLYERDFVSQQEQGHTMTDAQGRFRFTINASHVIQLEALKGEARSPRITIRLWFRAQDTSLRRPLILP